MKKLLFSFVALLIAISSTATKKIYINDQTGWDNMALYAWADGKVDTDLLGGWPGTRVTNTETVDGIVYKVLEVNEEIFPINIIVNNNNNGLQIDLCNASTARDYYFNVFEGSVSQIEETYHIYVNDQTGWETWLYAWGDREIFGNWDNQKKTADGTMEKDGITYNVYNMPLYKGETNPTFHLIFSNEGSEDNRHSFDVLEARDYYLNLTTTGLTEVGETIHKVYVDNQTGWNPVALYAYKGEIQPLGGWPGTVSTTTEVKDGITYLVYEIPANAFPCSIIFNDNKTENVSQLAEYMLETANDYYLTAAASGMREAGTPEPELETYHIYVNDQTGWETWLYAWGDREIFGNWNNQKKTADGTMEKDGITYNVYNMPLYKGETNPTFHLIFSNEGSEDNRHSFDVLEARDYYLNLTTTGLTEVGETIHKVYVDNQTGWNPVALYAYKGEIQPLGGWPGTVSTTTEVKDGITYLVYEIPANAFPCSIIFNDNKTENVSQLAEYMLETANDYYLTAAASGMREAGTPEPNVYHIYVENKTGWDQTALYAYDASHNPVLGDWPGQQAAGVVKMNGVTYLDFQLDAAAFPANFIFNNNGGGSQLGDLYLEEAEDYYLVADETLHYAPLSAEVYERNVTAGRYGTICLPFSSTNIQGATLYTIAGQTEDGNGLYLDSENTLQAYVPYFFLANASKVVVTPVANATYTPVYKQEYPSGTGLVGYIDDAGEDLDIVPHANHFILQSNALWQVNAHGKIRSNYAYVDWSAVPTTTAELAPGRQRRVIGAQYTTTALEEVEVAPTATKVLHNGQMFILRDGQMYSITGQIVK